MTPADLPLCYLGGPDVFYPNWKARAAYLKSICAVSGLKGMFPLDNVLDLDGLSPRRRGRAIKLANCKLIRRCEVVLINMDPFRGPGMDGGTSWEQGFAEGLGIAVFPYTSSRRSYFDRVEKAQDLDPADPRDPSGNAIESFDLADNLMMAGGPEDEEVLAAILASEPFMDYVFSSPERAAWAAAQYLRRRSP
jgi:nucleoside 2-deoxyribosyltransferase